MIDKPIREIAVADLDALVVEKRPESRSLDYKRDLGLSTDEHKRELARDVSSFANAGGGDLVFGIEEEKDSAGKNLGIPKAVLGVECLNFDATKQRIEAIIRDNIEPRVQGIAIHKVDGFARGPSIVVRVPRSWIGPHMVTSTQSTFWSRNSAGRYPLDVHETRAAFLAGAELGARARRFRDERLGKIIAGDTPILLRDDRRDAKVVVHIVPLSSDAVSLDLHKLDGDPNLFRPPSRSGGWNGRFNLDGVVCYAGGEGAQRTYAQAFRDGSFEGVTCGYQYPGKAAGSVELFGLPLETEVVQAVEVFFKALLAHNFGGPVCVMVAVLGVRGARIQVGEGWMLPPWERDITIDRDVLVLPEVVAEHLPADPRRLLRPTFDALWQSSGYKRSHGYSENGDWDEKRHRE